MIRARSLGRSFGTKRVLRDLDLDVAERDLLVVTGPNGSGKSTLLALCAGIAAAAASRSVRSRKGPRRTRMRPSFPGSELPLKYLSDRDLHYSGRMAGS